MPSNSLDKTLRLIVFALLATWLVFVGLIYHAEYPKSLIELTGQPWWRAIMVAAVFAAAYWCPRISALAALAVILYLADVRALTQL